MIPVDQTLFWTEEESHGNCMQAAVASLLELPLIEVPDFWISNHFWKAVYEFFNARKMIFKGMARKDIPNDTYYIVIGDSPRGATKHAVVYINGQMVHDPHPSRAGILTEEIFKIIVSMTEK